MSPFKNLIEFIRMAAAGPKPLVLCGPSGSGKSTLLQKLLQDYPDKFGFSVSHTTRRPREGEVNGVHYHFTTVEQMEKEIKQGKFIETATFGGNMYGTSKESVDRVSKAGKVCLLDIDVQGVIKVKQTSLNPWYIFIKPPSLTELENRLRKRNTENNESLRMRLKIAMEEMKYAEDSNNFDFVVINDNLEQAYSVLKDFINSKVILNPENTQN